MVTDAWLFLLALLVGLLILTSAAFAASETAIFTLVRLEHTREQLSPRVRRALQKLLRRPVESLVVVIAFNEASNVFAECLATTVLLGILGPVAPWVAAPLMLVVVLIFCDITPKTFALGYAGLVATFTARPLALLIEAAHPLAQFFAPISDTPSLEPVSESEFKALLRLGEHQGTIEPGERELIHRVFDFGNRRASEVMTPRERIFSLDIDTPPPQLVSAIAHGHYTRVPVYRGDTANIVGILHAKDLAARRLESQPPRIDRLVRPAYFVPPGKALGELFDEMRRGRFQMALVVNEFGLLLGLVTLEDLLEELFGEIRDEFDLEIPEFTRVTDREWTVSGGIEIRKLNEDLRGQPPIETDTTGRTLSALVLRKLRRVPAAGERLRLGEYQATVERVRGATIELVRLER